MSNQNKEKLIDLLTEKAIYGLDEQGREQLQELEKSFPEFAGDDSFDLAAAGIYLTDVESPDEPLPAALAARIAADADKYFAAAALEDNSPDEEYQKTFEFRPQPSGWRVWLGWFVAAAACVALAANIWITRLGSSTELAQTGTPSNTSEQLTLTEKYDRFVSSSADLVKSSWAAGNFDDAKGLAGEIVWSDSRQEGFMRFRGLPVNDPDKQTYQLWIFDETQPEKTPIDGGIFDVTEAGEVIVPIDARLKVRNPKMFAITVEKPGGVVVSDREKIAAIAQVEA